MAEHINNSGLVLTRYEGLTTKDIKDQLRQKSVLDNPDHAMYLGHELDRMHYELHGKLEEL